MTTTKVKIAVTYEGKEGRKGRKEGKGREGGFEWQGRAGCSGMLARCCSVACACFYSGIPHLHWRSVYLQHLCYILEKMQIWNIRITCLNETSVCRMKSKHLQSDKTLQKLAGLLCKLILKSFCCLLTLPNLTCFLPVPWTYQALLPSVSIKKTNYLTFCLMSFI